MSKSIDPAMHSAEHLLNQAMVQRFGTSRCFSAHIEKKKSKCDYRFHRPLTDAELRLLEADAEVEVPTLTGGLEARLRGLRDLE